MSPLPRISSHLLPRAFQPSRTSQAFSTQWRNPSDVFSVLLILGGDIIQQALAQLSGSRITPIAFSFGWVAYGVSAVSSAVGENRLMPPADCSCLVINGKSGYVRENVSWIIGRIVRDYESWMDGGKADGPIHRAVQGMLDERWEMDRKRWSERRAEGKDVSATEPMRPIMAGLCVSVFKAREAQPGTPGYDFLYYLGFVTMVVQLGIAAIPLGLYGDYGQILVTAVGIILALANGSLTQWGCEKWTSRKNTDKNVVLTRGNGSQHAIAILGDGHGLDLEDLAAVPNNVDVWSGKWTKVFTLSLGFLWICLLISASGLGDHSWFLLAIGGIGIVENIYVAGHWRTPEAYGVPLEFVEVICKPKVMHSLYEVEEQYPHMGRAMLETFFPGELSDEEETKWKAYKETSKKREELWKQHRKMVRQE